MLKFSHPNNNLVILFLIVVFSLNCQAQEPDPSYNTQGDGSNIPDQENLEQLAQSDGFAAAFAKNTAIALGIAATYQGVVILSSKDTVIHQKIEAMKAQMDGIKSQIQQKIDDTVGVATDKIESALNAALSVVGLDTETLLKPFKACKGRPINEVVGDICLGCMGPVYLAGIKIPTGSKGHEEPGFIEPPKKCTCPAPTPSGTREGVGFTIRLPSHAFETSTEPFCMPYLGGFSLEDVMDKFTETNTGVAPGNGQNVSIDDIQSQASSVMDGGIAQGTQLGNNPVNVGNWRSKMENWFPKGGQASPDEKALAIYHQHWYATPITKVLTAGIINPLCLKPDSSDTMWFSELDPTHRSDKLGLLLSLESSLLASPVAQLACAAEAGYSAIQQQGYGIPSLYWCAGSMGGIFPLSGNLPAHNSILKSSAHSLNKMAFKLHRMMLGQNTSGIAAMCLNLPDPFFFKEKQYSYQVMYPKISRQKSKRQKLFGFAQAPMMPIKGWGIAKEFPFREKNYAYQIYRRWTCCVL